jgi:hypothetical protein
MKLHFKPLSHNGDSPWFLNNFRIGAPESVPWNACWDVYTDQLQLVNP